MPLRIVYKGSNLEFGMGWGGGSHHLYVCTGTIRDIDPEDQWETSQLITLVHEMGHSLGLLNLAPSAPGAHDDWKDETNHHCIRPPEACAMFRKSKPERPRATTFHLDEGTRTGCHDHLRRQCFDRAVMTAHWEGAPAASPPAGPAGSRP